MLERLERVPAWAWLLLALAAGVGFLTWHAYARDPEDGSWLDPGQPPAMAVLPLTPAAHGCGRPMECQGAFRGRAYPGQLARLDLQLAGEV